MANIRCGLWVSLLLLCCPLSGAGADALQASITVQQEHCQTDLERTICTLAERLDALRQQAPYWNGPFETDPTCDAVLLVLAHKLGKASSTLRQETLERILTWPGRTADGWATYPGGPYDHNTTAIILLSLQAIGLGHEHGELSRPWETFERLGGIEKLTLTSRIFLDSLGLYQHTTLPLLSPRVVALSSVSPINIFQLGILRSVIIPQIGLQYYATVPRAQPVRKETLRERGHLFGQRVSPQSLAQTAALLPGQTDTAPYFTTAFLDAMVHHSDEFWAQEILAWTLRLQQADGTWYALASTINAVLLLHEAQSKGVADFSAEIEAAWNGLMQARRTSHQGTRFVQTILSTVWDTANALTALLNVSPQLLRQPEDHWHATIEWLLHSQYRAKEAPMGVHVPKAWSFSHLDADYLDSDDTAAALNALLTVYGMQPSARLENAMASAVAWLLPLQNADGGFPSWTRGMSKTFLRMMGPHFKDLIDVADESQADVTSRILYVLTRLQQEKALPGYQEAISTAIAQACTFLQRSATPLADQATPLWFGDWAINYIYATSFATMSLLHAGCWTPDDAWPVVQWLMQTQQSGGGWGESPESYKQGTYVPAPPTLFQTSTALLALLEYEERTRETPQSRHNVRHAIEQGIAYLIRTTSLGHHTQESTYTAVAVKGQMFVQYYYVPYYFTLYTLTKWHKNITKKSG